MLFRSPETEFRCGGQAHIARPTDPSTVDDGAWSEHLFVRANPKLVPPKNIKLKPGQVVYLPDVNVMRIVVMGEGTGPATMAVSGDVHYDKKPMIHVPASTAPAAIAPAAAVQNPPIAIPRLPVNVANNTTPAREVSPEEKKMWVRYP